MSDYGIEEQPGCAAHKGWYDVGCGECRSKALEADIAVLRRERDEAVRQGEMYKARYERAQNDLAEMQAKLQRARIALRDIAEGDAGWLEIAEEALAGLAEGGDG